MDNILNGKIVIRSKLEKDDYVKACKVIMKMRKTERNWILYLIMLVLFSFVVLNVALKNINGSDTVEQHVQSSQLSPAPWYIAYFPTIFFFAFIIFLIFFTKNALKRHYESNKLIQEEVQMTFDNMGIEYKSERCLSKIRWDEVYKVYISKDFLVIFISDRSVWIIPKKYVDYTDVSALVDTFKTNLEKKKVKIAKY